MKYILSFINLRSPFGGVLGDIVNGAGDLGSIPGSVKSDAVVPITHHRCMRCYFAIMMPNAWPLCRGDGPVTRFTLRRNTASIMKCRLDAVSWVAIPLNGVIKCRVVA